MAIINLTKIRTKTGSYERIIGNTKIGNLVRSIHAASISNGTKASEKLILAYKGNLPIFYGKDVNSVKKTLEILLAHPNGVVIFNGFYPNKKNTNKKKEIDVLIYLNGILYVYEIKDGNNLDTKKSESEIDTIENAKEYFEKYVKNVTVGLVCIYMDNKHQIKDERAAKYVVSGKYFLDTFNFDFESFSKLQNIDQPENEKIVLDEMEVILREKRPNLFI